jgi:AraC family transcriptional regulator
MEWVERMNNAIHYIEERLEGQIDYQAAARIACCSVHHFLRMFSFMAEVPLSEYIRRRRLTLAAFDLQSSDIKVIEVAHKYGYDSPEAFARAFAQLHGATPTSARHAGTKLKAYSRISFQISIKGAAEMNYRIEDLAGFAIVGAQESVDHHHVFEKVPALWEKAASEGLFERLWEIRAEASPLIGILGVCADGDFGRSESFYYMLSIVSNEAPTEGMTRREFPAATWAVFEAEGGPEGIAELWKRLYTDWLPVSGYELAYLPAIERYLPPEENRNELWVAVEPKK